MMKDLVLQLKYIGVIPKTGHREYGFQIEDKDKAIRKVFLTIDDNVFMMNQLMFQEAPDLCYQKMLLDLSNETGETPILKRAAITPSDVASYRDSHPTGRSRVRPATRRSA